MRNLIRVNFLRWKNKLSTIYCLIGTICCAVFNCVTAYKEEIIGRIVFDRSYFPTCMTAAMLLTAAAILLNRGEGDPVRNAVIAGYSKTQILLAELLPALVFACISALIMLLPMLRAPVVLRRFPAADLLLGAVGILLMFCTAAVLCVMLATICQNRAFAILLSTAVLLFGVITSKPLVESLRHPPTIPAGYNTFLDKDMKLHYEITEEKPNPSYVAPPDRYRVITLAGMLPQSVLTTAVIYLDTDPKPDANITQTEKDYLNWSRTQCLFLMRLLPFCETGMMLLITGLGLLRFRRTDMN